MNLIALLLGCGVPATPPATAASPSSTSPHVVRFVALGDGGKHGERADEVARAVTKVCAERGCDFGLMLGDNLYYRGMTSAEDPRMHDVFARYLATELPWYLVLGNHDYAHGRNVQRANWQIDWAKRTDNVYMPAATYQFEAGPATFLALDTTQVFWGNELAQVRWMSDALDRSSKRWRVVFGHHPYRSNGVHGNAGGYENWTGIPWSSGASLARLFDRGLCGRADLYLCGHDHSLQWLEACDTQLLVSGAAGSHTDLTGTGNRTAFEASQEGFVWIELGEQLTVAFYDSTGSRLFQDHRPAPNRP